MIKKVTIGKKSYYINVIENEDGTIIEEYLDDILTVMQREKLKEEKEKLKLEREKLELDKKEWTKMKHDAENNIDVIESNPNFYHTATDEEKACYEYLVNNKLNTTSRDLKNLLKSSKWKYFIYPKIKEEKDRINRQIEMKKLEAKRRNNMIAYICITIGAIIFLSLCMVGCHYENMI